MSNSSDLPEDDEDLDRLLAVAADESQPTTARLEAASALLPFFHDPVPPKHVDVQGKAASYAEWRREIQRQARERFE